MTKLNETPVEIENTVVMINDGQQLQQYLAMEPNQSIGVRTSWSDWLAADSDADQKTFQLAMQLDIPLIHKDCFKPDTSVLHMLGSQEVRRLRAMPLMKGQGRVIVAMENAGSDETINTLNFLHSERVMPVLVTPREMRDAIAKYYDREEDLLVSRQLGLDPNLQTPHSESDIEKLAREKPIVRIVTDMIAEAVQRRASDIHLRPGQHGLDALFRNVEYLSSREKFKFHFQC